LDVGTWQLPDDELIIHAIAGDLAAFDELAGRYRPAVTVTARQVIDDNDLVGDVVQDALLQAYRTLPTLRSPAAFGPWLRILTRRVALRARSREKADARRLLPLDLAVVLTCPNIRPDAVAEQREAQRIVRKAIDALDEDDATVVRLRFIDGVPVGRIGAYLGLSRDGAKWRLKRATRRLRAVLGQQMRGDEEDARPRACIPLLQGAQGA
jgi:RNA polymerase sigma-70 factor (ECF subfamily)